MTEAVLARRERRRRRVTVVLPAYNEEAAIAPLLDRLDAAFEEEGWSGDVLVVNDGSTDGTAAVVRGHRGRLDVRLLEFDSNRGLAEAMKAGLLAAAAGAEPDDVIVTMDADNTHTPDLIPRMVRTIREGSDVVIASRWQPGSRTRGVSWRRRLFSRGANLLFRSVVRIPGVRDYTCGYRAYRAGLLQTAIARYHDRLVQQRGFSCTAEILVRLRVFDPIVHEVPLILRYDFKPGASKIKVARTIGDTLALLVRAAFRRP